MRTTGSNFILKTLVLTLVFQLAMTPLIQSVQASGFDPKKIFQIHDQIQEEIQKNPELPHGLEILSKDLTGTASGSSPPPIRDRFGLLDQTVVFFDRRGETQAEVNLSKVVPGPIGLTVFDDKVASPHSVQTQEAGVGQIQYAVSDDRMGFEIRKYYPNGKVQYKHTKRYAQPIEALTWDQDITLTFDAKGVLYGQNAQILKKHTFRGLVPHIPVAKVSPPLLALEGETRLVFLNSGIKPFEESEIHPDAVIPKDKILSSKNYLFQAGDVVVLKVMPDGRRTVIGWYDRDVLFSLMALGEFILALEAIQFSPENEKVKLLKKWSENPAFDDLKSVRARARLNEGVFFEPEEASALVALGQEQWHRILQTSRENSRPSGFIRHSFKKSEWHADYEKIFKFAKDNGVLPDQHGDLSGGFEEWKSALKKGVGHEVSPSGRVEKAGSFFRSSPWLKLISVDSLLRLAGAVAIGYTGTQFGQQLYQNHPGLFWWVHTLNEWYDSVYHGVLADSVYRITLLKSVFYSSVLLPVVFGLGVLLDPKRPLDFAKNLSNQTLKRVFAWMIKPIGQYATVLLGSPNLLRALRRGQNPWELITPTSSLGKYLNLDRPTRLVGHGIFSGKEIARSLSDRPNQSGTKTARGAEILGAKIESENKIRLLASSLATLVVSKAHGVPMPSLVMMQSQDRESPKNLKELYNSWNQAAHLSYQNLMELSRAGEFDEFQQIRPEDFQKYLQQSEAAYLRLKASPLAIRRKADFDRNWSQFCERFRTLLGRALLAGDREHHDIRTLQFNRFASDQSWKDLVLDHYSTLFQVALFGARANPADPSNLLGKEGAFLATHPAQVGETVDAFRINMTDVPASIALVFREGYFKRDHQYLAKEYWLDLPATKRMGFIQGMVNWTKGAFNIYDNRFGDYMLKDFIVGFKTVNAALIFGLLMRGLVLYAGSATGLSGVAAFQSLHNFSIFFGGFSYLYLLNRWTLGGWWTFLNVGNEKYDRDHRKKVVEYLTERARLLQGIRNKKFHEIDLGYENLSKFYSEKSEYSIEKGLIEMVREVEEFLGIESSERVRFQSDWAQDYASTARLFYFWKNNSFKPHSDPAGQKRTQLLDMYSRFKASKQGERKSILHPVDSEYDERKAELTAFMDYVTEHPPVHLKNNRAWPWVSTFLTLAIGSFFSAAISVRSYQLGDDWMTPVLELGATTAAVYGAAYLGQKAVDYYHQRKKTKNRGDTDPCGGAMSRSALAH